MNEDQMWKAFGQAPHCDARVLHAPGVCRYCDERPILQAARFVYGINFTGEHDPEKTPCPAEQRRPLATIDHWPGNVVKR